MRLPEHLEFFSLGGIVATFWKPQTRVLPWIATAVALGLMSCWDAFRGFGRVDLIVMGLAGYELTIGLTEDCERQQPTVSYGLAANYKIRGDRSEYIS